MKELGKRHLGFVGAAIALLLVLSGAKSDPVVAGETPQPVESSASATPGSKADRPASLAGPAAPAGSPRRTAIQLPQGPSASQIAAEGQLERYWGTSLRVAWDENSGCPRRILFPRPILLGKARLSDVLARLSPLYGFDLRTLRRVSRQRFGRRRVIRLEQHVDGIPVRDAKLAVVVEVGPQGPVLVELCGQVHADLPLHLPAPRVESERVVQGRVRLKGWEARAIVVRGPEGRWVAGEARVELHEGLPHQRVRHQGRLIASRVAVCTGRAQTRVFSNSPSEGSTVVGVPGLRLVNLADGRTTLLTGAGGTYGPAEVGLVSGFRGTNHMVVPRFAAYPTSRGERLDLRFDNANPRLDEANAFHHIGAARTWLAGFGSVPGVRAALRQRILVECEGSATRAYCSDSASVVGGQTYDTRIVLGTFSGQPTSRDASVIRHEWGHSLLLSYGISLGGGDLPALHEGMADYLASVQTGRPTVGRYALGSASRDVSQLRVYPQDEVSDPHETGLILAGALWDARQAAGSVVDGLALRLLSRVHGSMTLLEMAQTLKEITEETAPSAAPAMIESLTRHGLLPRELGGNTPPELTVNGGQGYKILNPAADGPTTTLLVEALDRPDRPVQVSYSDPDGLVVGRRVLSASTEHGVKEELQLSTELPAGIYELTVTVEDEGGETTTRSMSLHVVRPRPDVYGRLEFEAPVGRETRFPLVEALEKASIGAVESGDLLTFRLRGQRVADARVDGGELVVQPVPGDEGVYSLQLFVSEQNSDDEREITVELTIGEDYLRVRGQSLNDETLGSDQLLAPGRPVLVQGGESSSFRAAAVFGAQEDWNAVFSMGGDVTSLKASIERGAITITPEAVNEPLLLRLEISAEQGPQSVAAGQSARSVQRVLTILVLPQVNGVQTVIRERITETIQPSQPVQTPEPPRPIEPLQPIPEWTPPAPIPWQRIELPPLDTSVYEGAAQRIQRTVKGGAR